MISSTQKIGIAILDDYQNLSEAHIAQFKSLTSTDITVFTNLNEPVPDRRDHSALIKALYPYSVISTMRERTPFPKEVVGNLPNLRLLLTTGPYNASIDIDACKEAGIIVAGTGSPPPRSNGASTGPSATTQHTWALILGLANNIARDDLTVKTGGWQHQLPIATTLSGQTFACLGLGRLGTEAAKIASTAFGMRVLAWSSSLTQDKADAQAHSMGLAPGSFEVAPSKAALFENADVLSVHYVLSARSKNIVSKPELALLKPSAMLINTSRGPLIEEGALFDVLAKGKIRGAALDVFWTEPLPEECRWRSTKWGTDGRSEVLMAPHTGYVSEGTMQNWWQQTSENIRRFLDHEEIQNRLC